MNFLFLGLFLFIIVSTWHLPGCDKHILADNYGYIYTNAGITIYKIKQYFLSVCKKFWLFFKGNLRESEKGRQEQIEMVAYF